MLEFVRGRNDVVVFGATAVNAYVSEPRMTQDIDLMSTGAVDLAEELRDFLSERFHIAVRVRTIGEGKGYRVFQVRKEGNRHLVDIRPVTALPESQRIEDVPVVSPPALIALKVAAYHTRRGNPKSFSDRRDLAMLLLAFPELKKESGAVEDSLKSLGVSEEVLSSWRELVAEEIRQPEDDEEFDSFTS
ncbi:MAG TPA: nucleotidyl transferase AbiEii/AbiGii toxin family protein [Pyrinomonadaceae bacterium]